MEYDYQVSNQVTLEWVLKNMPKFLFPDLAKKKDRIQKKMIGVVATHERTPVGLLLATDDNSGKNFRIHSFLVHPKFRNKGIGSAILDHLEQYLFKIRGENVDLYYRQHWPFTPYLKKILERQGWDIPRQDLIIVKGDAINVNKLFMHKQIQLPESYSFTPFLEISKEDQAYILGRKKRENWYLDYLDPFVQPETICAPASLALRKDGHIIGWVISHLIAPHLNEFTALFIDQQHRPYKQAHILMREAITRQQQAGIRQFLITSKVDNQVMSRFLMRHADETEVFITQSFYTKKSLIE
ncbi:MAG: GNAT family N-acetyltransferase [Saprospiraceae bacterium]|nr:GNAT family N-acetyltransferase [Saprospiraceae bacterium]